MFHLFKIKFIKQVTELTMFIKDARKLMKMLLDFFLLDFIIWENLKNFDFGTMRQIADYWFWILDFESNLMQSSKMTFFYFENKKEICMIGILSKRAWIATKPQNHFKLPKKNTKGKGFIHTE